MPSMFFSLGACCLLIELLVCATQLRSACKLVLRFSLTTEVSAEMWEEWRLCACYNSEGVARLDTSGSLVKLPAVPSGRSLMVARAEFIYYCVSIGLPAFFSVAKPALISCRGVALLGESAAASSFFCS